MNFKFIVSESRQKLTIPNHTWLSRVSLQTFSFYLNIDIWEFVYTVRVENLKPNVNA